MTGYVSTSAVLIHSEIKKFPLGFYTDENTKYWSHGNAILRNRDLFNILEPFGNV
jgi:hypothetical protein